MAGHRILLRNAHYAANLGITKKEKQFVQPVIMDITITPYDGIKNATANDDIEKTINYSIVNKMIQKLLDSKEFHLIETLAVEVVELIQSSFRVSQVDIVVKKPQALKNVEYTAVEYSTSSGPIKC